MFHTIFNVAFISACVINPPNNITLDTSKVRRLFIKIGEKMYMSSRYTPSGLHKHTHTLENLSRNSLEIRSKNYLMVNQIRGAVASFI